MAQTKSLKGCKIQILQLNGAGWLKKGSVYTVKNATDNNTMLTVEGAGIAWKCGPNDYVVVSRPVGEVEDIFTFVSPSVGDTITLTKNYFSVKGGGTAVVEEVIDKNRIKVKGCLPGGFIYTKDVVRKIDMKSLRLKTIEELMLDFGIYDAIRVYFSRNNAHMYGKNLEELGAIQNGNTILLGTWNPGGPLLCRATDPYRKCKIVFNNEVSPEFIGKNVLELCSDLTHMKIALGLASNNTMRGKSLPFNIRLDYLFVETKGEEVDLPF